MSPSSTHSTVVISNTKSTSEVITNHLPFSKNKVIKNFLVISSAWWIFFSTYDCLIMLQSTLNSENGIGVISIAVQFSGAIFVSLLFPKYCLKKLGCKRIIILSIIFHMPYISANFIPHWIVMILSSIIVSAGNPLLWTALCAYLNDLSILYADHIQIIPENTTTNYNGVNDKYTYKLDDDSCYDSKNVHLSSDILKCKKSEVTSSLKENVVADVSVATQKFGIDKRSSEIISKYHSSTLLEGITARFFGLHAMICYSCHIIGNIVPYYIFKYLNIMQKEEYITNSTCSCGADFCNDQLGCLEGNLRAPGNEIRYTLTAVCLVFAVISLIIIILFLDDLKEKEKHISLSLDTLMASCKILKSLDFVFLIPMTFYVGILCAFVTGDYTQAFIGCAWGIQNISLVLTMFGVALTLSSSICGWLVKYWGRLPIFLFTAALNAITFALLLFWQPNAEKPSMMFVTGGFLGFVIGTYWSQTRAFYGILFKEDEEAAFGSYQIWFSLGAALGFGYSKYLCTSIKIHLILIYSTLAILGYLVVEMSYLKRKQRNK